MYLRRCCSTARRRAPPRQTMGAAACARGLGGRSSRPNWALSSAQLGSAHAAAGASERCRFMVLQ